MTYIREFRRAGILLSAREMAGTLHVVTQHSEITDLGWTIFGVGYVGANLHICSSWDANGNWIRNIAAISLSSDPTYTFDVYLGCDYARQANLAPSGNWYIPSLASSVTKRYSFNTIIQKVHRIQPSPSRWVGLLKNTFTPLQGFDLDEDQNCTLRVPGLTLDIYPRLKFYAFGCKTFAQKSTFGFILREAPIIKDAKTVKWMGSDAYVSF